MSKWIKIGDNMLIRKDTINYIRFSDEAYRPKIEINTNTTTWTEYYNYNVAKEKYKEYCKILMEEADD